MERYRLPDGGVTYYETNLEHYVVEPWNAITAAIFLIMVVYWFFKIKNQFGQFPFITYVLPLLLVGGIGGTLYHAFRSYSIYLYMDWLPIMILVFSASAYFLKHYFASWWKALAIIFSTFLLIFFLFRFIPPELRFYAINLNYFIDALLVIIPIVLTFNKVSKPVANNVYWAILSFAFALFCRSTDHLGWLPIGSHFLWHIFGALACHLMLRFIYGFEKQRNLVLARA